MDNPNEISILDILELSHSLRQEKLSIENEKSNYIRLTENLSENSSEAIRIAWICAGQRQNLNSLILSNPDSRPSSCCQRANLLENIKFIDAYKDPAVKYQHLLQYIELFRFLHQSPHLLAQCLSAADELPLALGSTATTKADQMNTIVQIISVGLYGNAIHGKDVEMILKLLEKLLELQVATSEIPRRLLRLSSSSFAKLYHKFHESSLSAKLFLTAALHEPVMAVLIDDDIMLDIDPQKMIASYPVKDKIKRFGNEDCNEFEENIRKFREEIISSLFGLVNKFIKSLNMNWIIFPSTIRWLVQTMSRLLKQKGFDPKTINEILTDMVFSHFICPACVSPDLYGIADAPISENARFNLSQIGQILQMLALVKYQEMDQKFDELYRRFDENVISHLMEQLLENTYDISEMGLSHQLPTLYNIGRNSILITHSEVELLMQFLRATADSIIISDEDRSKLKELIDDLPNLVEPVVVRASTNGVETSPSRKSKIINSLSKQTKNKVGKTASLTSEENGICNGNNHWEDSYERVLVIPLTIYENSNRVTLLSEDEVLNMNNVCNDIPDEAGTLTEKNVEELSRRNEENEMNSVLRANIKEKNTRFSLNQDDVSIGNTSDNLEAVSEAPSNHSVASSLDLEENNDNLSDMVSANVSGRGTPNISGRDTPSSQVIDGGEVQQIPTPQMAKILNKARNDIEDKFCKFEIKKLLEGDETISIISDTWSTDVLASDSETIEASERNFSTPLIPSNVILPDTFQLRAHNFDISETQSESAWSTDVLIASDSEKMTEIDNDDTLSMTARSDITDSMTPLRPIRNQDFGSGSSGSAGGGNPGSSRNSSFTAAFNYLATPPALHPRPLRQHSNESQNSTHSMGYEQEQAKYKSPSREKKEKSRDFVEHQQALNIFRVSDSNLENFPTSIDGSKIIKTNVNLINPFISRMSGRIQAEEYTEEVTRSTVKTLTMTHDDHAVSDIVEHRRLSAEQRNANFDSRRNGMIDLLASPTTPINTAGDPFSEALISLTDDIKNQQQQQKVDVVELVTKTEQIKLNEGAGTSSGTASKVHLSNGSVNGTFRNGKSTGAIPKSISFDATADKADRISSNYRRSEVIKISQPNSQNQPTGLFNKIRQGFKNRKGKSRHSVDETMNSEMINGSPHRQTMFAGNAAISFMDSTAESSDDILAKYRRKPSSSSDAATSDSTGSNNSSSLKSKSSDNENRLSHVLNQETDYFLNAKRKLRLVLSSSDCHACDVRNNNASTISPLLSYLQIQLAQALNQQNLQQISYVSEVLRCLNSLDARSHYKLVEELQKDLLHRQTYLQYLIRLRQDMLSTIATIDNFQKRLQNDRDMTNRNLIMVCIRMFLEKRESMVTIFQEEFNEKLVVDEKLELMEEYIGILMDDLKNDGILMGMADWQLQEAHICIERILLQRLYRQVMFPNGDVNISTDQVLHDHIRKLSRIITPSHTSLRIPQRYLNEAPWPFAQQQIAYISAYKTPQEKVQCVVRCIRTIMNLLRMASERTPAADDLIPVLIYVIIKANPPFLLSTIQYVECFIGKKLEGEELYWWTQFSSAIQFIKTMDYSD
ncbi:unnamed protein product [Diamesa serratosioi]